MPLKLMQRCGAPDRDSDLACFHRPNIIASRDGFETLPLHSKKTLTGIEKHSIFWRG